MSFPPAGTSSSRASSRRAGNSEAGVSLLESLAALALTALLVALMLPILAQTLSHGSAGIARAQRLDQLMRASISLQDELAGIDPLRFFADATAEPAPWFAGDGEALIFIRRAPGSARPEVVSLTVDQDGEGVALLRRSAAFGSVAPDVDPRALPSPNAVLTGAAALRFVYLDTDGASRSSWIGQAELPAAVQLIIHPAGRGRPNGLTLSFPVVPRRLG